MAPAVARVHAVVDDHAITTGIAPIIAGIGIIVAVIIGPVETKPQRKTGPEAIAMVKTMVAAAPASAVKTAKSTVEATATEAAMATRAVR